MIRLCSIDSYIICVEIKPLVCDDSFRGHFLTVHWSPLIFRLWMVDIDVVISDQVHAMLCDTIKAQEIITTVLLYLKAWFIQIIMIFMKIDIHVIMI